MAAGAPNFRHLQQSIPARISPSCAGRDLTRRSLGPRLAAQTVQSPGRGAPWRRGVARMPPDGPLAHASAHGPIASHRPAATERRAHCSRATPPVDR